MWDASSVLTQAAVDGLGTQPDGGWMGTMGMGTGGITIMYIVVWFIVLGILAAGIYILIRILRMGRRARRERLSALNLLEDRYARGEIGREEYLERKKGLS